MRWTVLLLLLLIVATAAWKWYGPPPQRSYGPKKYRAVVIDKDGVRGHVSADTPEELEQLKAERIRNGLPPIPPPLPGSRAYKQMSSGRITQSTIIAPGQPAPSGEGWIEYPLEEAVKLHSFKPPTPEEMKRMLGLSEDTMVIVSDNRHTGPHSQNSQAGTRSAQAAPGTQPSSTGAAEKPNLQFVKGIVGSKSIINPQPDLGANVTLQIPPRPKNPVEAFYYKHTVDEALRLCKDAPKARDQKAIDMLALWCKQRSGISVPHYQICLPWREVSWRHPLADFVYETCEYSLVTDFSLFSMIGPRFLSTSQELEAAGCTAYMRYRAHLSAANSILELYPKEPIKRLEAQKQLDKGMKLLPALLLDPDLPVEALLDKQDQLVQILTILESDPGLDMRRYLETVNAKRPEFTPVLKGRFLVSYAWHARGTGFANTVTDEGWRLMEERLKSARRELTEAWERAPSVHVAETMMSVCMGQSDEKGSAVWFNRAINLRPDSKSAHWIRLQTLCAKWQGSHEQMFAFARECVDRYKRDPSISYDFVYRLLEAHVDYGGNATPDYEKYLAQPEVYAEIKAALELVLKHHPKAIDAWSQLAFHADIAKDYKTVIAAFSAQEKLGLVSTAGFQHRHLQLQAHTRAEQVLSGKGKP